MAGYLLFYLFLAFSSYFAIKKDLNEKYELPPDVLLKSNNIVGISVVAPAFNESANIVLNVKSLLSLRYPKFEIVIVNDGSKDDTLEKLIKHYSLKKVPFSYDEKIKTKPVRGHYKSTNPIYSRLLVVDKENGGSKADASNAGINSCQYPIFVCTDVDCILKKDTLLKLVKPFLSESKRVIATGAGIRASNSCEVKEGSLKKVRFPREWYPRFQELEYVRAFLFGRMAWSNINGLMLVSGGLGMFEKKAFFEAGGYWHDSLGEDMELITRMRKMMHEKKEAFVIKYIPESLCWTEVPATKEVLIRQRARWSRGLAQTLWLHKDVFLNPKYGITGLVVFPYFFFFEFLVPILELLGLIVVLISFFVLEVNLSFLFWMTLTIYLFFQSTTLISILIDEYLYKNYNNLKEIFWLIAMSLIEPLFYHPVNTFAYLKGYWLFFRNKKSVWGDMQRKGFKTEEK
ncbi:MAG: glycosyltransferase family 2 protein [Bacteroidota bacterium]